MDSASLKQVFNLRGANIRKRFRRKEFRSSIDILDAPEETCTGQDVAEECRVGLQGTKGDLLLWLSLIQHMMQCTYFTPLRRLSPLVNESPTCSCPPKRPLSLIELLDTFADRPIP